MGIETVGTMPDGRAIERLVLSDGGLSMAVLTYGAIVQSLHLAPYAHSLVLGLDAADAYLDDDAYLGAVVGRVANRIAGGRFALDGETHRLDRNEGAHTLHGGAGGTAHLLWTVAEHGPAHALLRLDLADGHMGFPGAVSLQVRYAVSEARVEIAFSATAAARTVCNLAPHLYFNLDGAGDARDHRLEIVADAYLPTDDETIPTGERRAVEGTPFDFRKGRTMRAGGAAYDHNFCLAEARRDLTRAVTLHGPRSGLSMTLETTEPGVQVYDGAGVGHAGLALEPQGWPDAPNRPDFPPVTLDPGETLHQTSRLTFHAP